MDKMAVKKWAASSLGLPEDATWGEIQNRIRSLPGNGWCDPDDFRGIIRDKLGGPIPLF